MRIHTHIHTYILNIIKYIHTVHTYIQYSTWMVDRMISLWSSPSKGSFPQRSRNNITPTDHRSASMPYLHTYIHIYIHYNMYVCVCEGDRVTYPCMVSTSGATYERVPQALSIFSFGKIIYATHTYIHTCIHSLYIYTVHICIHKYIQKHIYTYIHTYSYTE